MIERRRRQPRHKIGKPCRIAEAFPAGIRLLIDHIALRTGGGVPGERDLRLPDAVGTDGLHVARADLKRQNKLAVIVADAADSNRCHADLRIAFIRNGVFLFGKLLAVRGKHRHGRLQSSAGIITIEILKLRAHAADVHAGPAADDGLMYLVKVRVRAVMLFVIMMSAGRNSGAIGPRGPTLCAPRHAHAVLRAGLGREIDRLMHPGVRACVHQRTGRVKPAGFGNAVVQIGFPFRQGRKAGVAAVSGRNALPAAIADDGFCRMIIKALLAELVSVRRTLGREHGERVRLLRRIALRIPRPDRKAAGRRLGGQTDALLREIAAGEINHTVASKAGARGIIIALGSLPADERWRARIRAVRDDKVHSGLFDPVPGGVCNRSRRQ